MQRTLKRGQNIMTTLLTTPLPKMPDNKIYLAKTVRNEKIIRTGRIKEKQLEKRGKNK